MLSRRWFSRYPTSSRPSNVRCKMRDLICLVVVAVLLGSSGYVVAQGIDILEKEITGLVDRVGESVVSVAAVSRGLPRSAFASRGAAKTVGCGIVFDTDGHILTTTSVVGFATKVEIGTRDGRRYTGTVIGSDTETDLAVIRVESDDLKPASFSPSTKPQAGSLVLVIGNAFGTLPSVSIGVVSSATEDGGSGDGMLRLSVPINPGEIGGPVVNIRGEVVGIVIGRLSFESRFHSPWLGEGAAFGRAGTLQPSNMSVAMRSARALSLADEIMKTGRRDRAFLGVRVIDLTDEMRVELGDRDIAGVIVTDVVSGSPAESIGIVPGDVILNFGSTATASVPILRNAVSATSPGEIIDLTLLRERTKITDGVRIGRFLPEYVRQATLLEECLEPEEIRARMERLKAEIETLRGQLKDLEKRN